MNKEIIRWGKPDPEIEVFTDSEGIRNTVFPRQSINLTYSLKNPFQISPLTYHPYQSETWLHTLDIYDEDDLIMAIHSSMKPDGKVSIRVRGTNMKTLRERGEQFARFNFEINI